MLPYLRALLLQGTARKGQHPVGQESVAEVCKAESRATHRQDGFDEAVQITLLFLHSHSYHSLTEMALESDLCFQKETDNKDKQSVSHMYAVR